MPMFISPVIDRYQYYFLRETLETSIPDDHPVRVFDFVLDEHDWSKWHARYPGGGRPAYPAEAMCKLLVYGYSVGIRSSRALEQACGNNRDFIWLMSGRTPDHDTIAAFRREHGPEFKKIFRTTVAVCVEAGMVSLKRLMVDGTRVEANNSSQRTKTAADLEEMLKGLDARIEKILAEAEAQDGHEDELFGREGSPNTLPAELKDLRRQQEKLRQALDKVRGKMARAMAIEGATAEEAARKRVPITDPDSEVMKNKKGGFGPNFTPFVGTDAGQVIVAEGVTNSHHDDDHLMAAIEEAETATGQTIEQVQADSGYTTPGNLRSCELKGIDPCMAPIQTSLERSNAGEVIPPWPSDVPCEADHAEGFKVNGLSFPRDRHGKFAKAAFRYEASKDCYLCPTGQKMEREGNGLQRRKSGQMDTVYRCRACKGCSFRPVCTSDPKGRRIKRREYEEVHERQAERMRDPQRREDYKLRKQTVEPVIGVIKEIVRLRRFLLRGLEGVCAEWSLACAAFNLKKLAACTAGLAMLRFVTGSVA